METRLQAFLYHHLCFAFHLLSLKLLWNYSQSKAVTTKDMLVTMCISVQHSSTKHYLSPQTPLKSQQMSCLLGRTQHSNQPVKVLHRDTSGSKSREAVTTKVPHRLPCTLPAAPHCCRQRDPLRRLCSLSVAHVLRAAAGISPGALK